MKPQVIGEQIGNDKDDGLGAYLSLTSDRADSWLIDRGKTVDTAEEIAPEPIRHHPIVLGTFRVTRSLAPLCPKTLLACHEIALFHEMSVGSEERVGTTRDLTPLKTSVAIQKTKNRVNS